MAFVGRGVMIRFRLYLWGLKGLFIGPAGISLHRQLCTYGINGRRPTEHFRLCQSSQYGLAINIKKIEVMLQPKPDHPTHEHTIHDPVIKIGDVQRNIM